MILALLVFGFGLAQVLVQRDVFSRETKFHLGIAAISLSAIPLLIQFLLLLLELIRLLLKYWIKLLIHRLLMNVGRSEPGSKVVCKAFSPPKFPVLSELAPGVFTDELYSCWLFPQASLNAWVCVLLFCGFSFVCMLGSLLVLPVIHLIGAAAFGDAFLGTYHSRSLSVAIWLEDEQNVDFFYDSEGRKLISKWDYPYILEATTPLILRNLDLKRMDLVKRLKVSPGLRACLRLSDQENLKFNELLRREENLRWDKLEKIDWDELFQREEAFAWEALSGRELMEELLKLEKLKLQIRRLEQEQLGAHHTGQREAQEQSEKPNWPLQPDLLEHLRDMRTKQKEQQKDQMYDTQSLIELDVREHAEDLEEQWETVRKLKEGLQSMRKPEMSGRRTEMGRQLQQQQHRLLHMNEKLHQPHHKKDELVSYEYPDEAWGSIQRWRKSQGELKSLALMSMKKLRKMQWLETVEPDDGRNKGFSTRKAIRNIVLDVVFLPDLNEKLIRYSIRVTTGSQDCSLSKFYQDGFHGACDAAKAAEFLKLLEIMDDDAFVVKNQDWNLFLLQVENFANRGPFDNDSFFCEDLEVIVDSILKDGKN